MPAITTIKIRQGSASSWSSANPVLASGEPGFDSTNKILKIGDGSSSWSALTSFSQSSSKNTILSDFVVDTNYIGTAPSGSLSSQSVWTIRKTVYSSGGSVSSNTSATNVKWDDRLTATYS